MIQKIKSFIQDKNRVEDLLVKTLEESIGKILQSKRLEKKIEISEVAKVLRVKIKNIEAIEDDNFLAVDNNIYVFGVIREYAKFLGIENIGDKLKDLKKRSDRFVITKINYDAEEENLPTRDLVTIITISLIFIVSIYLIYSYKKSRFQEKSIGKIISQNYEKSHQ